MKIKEAGMTIKECYEKVGSDYDGVLKRLGSEALVKRFAVKFLNDPSFQELTDGLAAQDGEKAFRAAHTLKGVCLNLGFTELYKVSAELTEVLRGRETAGSDALYAQVKELTKEDMQKKAPMLEISEFPNRKLLKAG